MQFLKIIIVDEIGAFSSGIIVHELLRVIIISIVKWRLITNSGSHRWRTGNNTIGGIIRVIQDSMVVRGGN